MILIQSHALHEPEEIPFRVQVGILCIILGILLICGGVMYGLITDPVHFLNDAFHGSIKLWFFRSQIMR